MKRNAGFTLIELVIVIVILGILAVTAAPKFMNMQSEARISTLNSLKGSVASANAMVYSKAIISGIEKTNGATSITVNGTSVTTNYGYPSYDATTGIGAVVDLSDWTTTANATAKTLTITPKNYTPSSGTCNVVYTEATNATTAATVSVSTGGC